MLEKLTEHHSFRQNKMGMLRCGLIMLGGLRDGLGSAIADGFSENGCDVRIVYPQSTWDFDKCDFIVTYGPMQSLMPVISRLTAMAQVPPLVVWFTEQVPQPELPNLVIYLAARTRYFLERAFYSQSISHRPYDQTLISTMFRRGGRLRALGEMLTLKQQNVLKLICTFTDTNSYLLQRFGLPTTLIPMGYHPQFGERLALKQDIDVVFLGSTRDRRRKRFVRELEDNLSSRGITFIIRDGSPEHGYVFGKERTVLLNRAKIMLNIMRQPWDDLVFRLLLAAPNGAMLLSEQLLPTSMGPFRLEEHFAMANLADMVEAIEFYLAREDERQRIAECAYDFVNTQLTMGRMASKILRTLDL